MTYFRDQRVLITGGSRGIGRLLAEKLAAQGAHLILWARNGSALEAVAKDLSGRGQTCATYVCDVTDRAQVYATAERVLREHGTIDLLINNAGVVSGANLLDLSDESIEASFATNALALFWTTRAFLPGMIERGRGHIVTIASAAGVVGSARQTDYAASKHAAVGFDESLRQELRHLGHRGIKTTVACPYYVATGMFDGARPATPLLPIQDPDRTAERILRAIRRGKRRLFLPRFVITTYLVHLAPLPVFDFVLRLLGVTRSMDNFRGRPARH